jgi:hypothetical protein
MLPTAGAVAPSYDVSRGQSVFMSKEDLAKFLAAVAQVSEVNTASPEAARNFLEEAGYLNRDGSIADPYKSAQSSKDD